MDTGLPWPVQALELALYQKCCWYSDKMGQKQALRIIDLHSFTSGALTGQQIEFS